jgi:aspartate aminotransferase
MAKMKAILSHIGAWAPMAEQKAVANYLKQTDNIQNYLSHFKGELEERLTRIYDGFMQMKQESFSVDAMTPQAAIYLTVKIDLVGKTKAGGDVLLRQEDVSDYILSEAKLAIVPFSSFGGEKSSPWYRLSVGTCKKEEIDEMLGKLKDALSKLK